MMMKQLKSPHITVYAYRIGTFMLTQKAYKAYMKENYTLINCHPLIESENAEDSLYIVTLRRNPVNNKER